MRLSGKPIESIKFLCDMLKPYSVRLTKRELSIYLQCKTPTGDDAYIIILKGSAEIYRYNDGLLLASVKSPSILGIAESRCNKMAIKIKASNDAIIYRIDAVMANNLIEMSNSQDKVNDLLSCIIMQLHQREVSIINKTAYEIVRELLYEIDSMNSDSGSEINVSQYIVSRTGISRSRTYTILKELKEGGYIQFWRGRLLGILKKLPVEF